MTQPNLWYRRLLWSYMQEKYYFEDALPAFLVQQMINLESDKLTTELKTTPQQAPQMPFDVLVNSPANKQTG